MNGPPPPGPLKMKSARSFETPVTRLLSVIILNTTKFYILLTVHLGTVLVNEQLDALF